MAPERDLRTGTTAFSEKGFYLAEFRGRTLGIAVRDAGGATRAAIESVLKELEANPTRVVLIASEAATVGALLGTPVAVDDVRAPDLEGAVWRGLSTSPRVGVLAGALPLEAAWRSAALRLGLSKLVWLDPGGGLARRAGVSHSFVDLAALRGLRAAGLPDETPERRALLREVEQALEAGLPAFNLCTPEGLADELFTYAGSGTLFTRERYVEVRKLSLDDYDAANDLIARGVDEGYLAPRTPAEIDRVLANGFGAFVEGRHLAGIGALLEYPDAGVAEIASLYTLTRFHGEGIGGHLLAFAVEDARRRSCTAVVACTTRERVAGFFERNGFARVGPEAVPERKWRDYDPGRRGAVLCLRRELSGR